MNLFFVHSYLASKLEEKVSMRLKKRFSNQLLMVRMNLSLDDVRNYKETTVFVKERNPQFGV